MSVEPTTTQGTRPSTSFVDWLMRYLQMTEPMGAAPEALRLLEVLQSNQRQPLSQRPEYASMLQAIQARAQQTPPPAPTPSQSFLDYLRSGAAQGSQGKNTLFDFIANFIRQHYAQGQPAIQPGMGQIPGGGASRVM
jgi:hypothetical protein